ncbi:MAG: rRNA adenine dimethyltransferase family protein, partial [Ginsengibacter sp.]
FLQKKFPELNGKIIHESILTMKLPFNEPFTIIGNFPYNISTQILFKIIEWKDHVPNAIGMFQKEVAERVASKEGSKVYGVISLLVQYYYDVEYLFSVNNKSFAPPPKVQSAVIKLTAKKDLFPVKSEKAFWLLVKTAFNQRRKTLRNALKSIMPKEVLEDKLFDRRAETLSLEEFANLTFKM